MRKIFLLVISFCSLLPLMSLAETKTAPVTDQELLDRIQRTALNYFVTEASPVTGLVYDHANNFGKKTGTSPASIAATGFALAAYAVGVERGWTDRKFAQARTLLILREFLSEVPQEHGFFYHFLNPKTGKRSARSEVSPVDTAWFLAGALFASAYYEDPEIQREARELYERVDWPWMLHNGKTFALFWTPEKGFSGRRWDHYDESMLMYLLAIGSPTHPIPPEIWHAIARPVGSYHGHRLIQMPPLFTHQYSHIWVDFRNKNDGHADYFKNSVEATLANRDFAVDQSPKYKTYHPDRWGLSASDTPLGYRAFGAPPGWAEHDGTISPSACGSSIVFTPKESLACLRHLYENFQERLWGKYGFSDAMNLDKKWFDESVIGIDQGALLLMIENYRSGLLWKTMNQDPSLQNAMKAAGFKEGTMNLPWPDPPEAAAPYVLGGIQVDGYMKDWPYGKPVILGLSHKELGEFKDADDLRGEIRFAWDEEALYFFIKVKDDSVVLKKRGALIWQDDCFELFVDPQGDGLDWRNDRDYQIGFRNDSVTNEVHVWSWFQNEDPSKTGQVRARGFVDQEGYLIEGAVSWGYLGMTPAPGKVIRLSPALHDVDQDHSEGKLNWFFRSEEGYKRFVLGKVTLEKSNP